MPWTETTRPNYCRKELTYASNLRDEEWEVVKPLLPEQSKVGRPRKVDFRGIVNDHLLKAEGYENLPKRWVVERTFAWLGQNRRLTKDFEKETQSVIAWCMIGHIKMLTRRLAK